MKLKLSPTITLVFLPCILLWQIFLGRCLLPANLLRDVYPWRSGIAKDLVPWNVLQFDGITQFYPWRLFAARTWLSGYVPLWNPHQFCGSPFLANGQSAVLYPPNLLFVVISPMYAFGWSDLLHLIFTGVMAYLFFRRANGCSQWAATIGSAAWQLSTWQISWLALPTFLTTSAWLPLALLAVWGLSRKPTLVRCLALAVVIAMMLLAGHLQVAFYCLSLTVFYALFACLRNRTSLRQVIAAAAATAVVAALLVSAQLLPTLELSRFSPRTGGKPSEAGYAGYVALAMPAEQLTALFVPGFFGRPTDGSYWGATNYAENAGYVGVIGLLLAFVAIVRKHPGADRLFFGATALIALLIATGTIFDRLLYFGFPGFAATGSPARILVLWSFSIAALAAYGVDGLLENPSSAIIGSISFVVAGGVTGVATALALLHRSSAFQTNIDVAANDIRFACGWILAAVAVGYLLWRKTLSPLLASLLLLALVCIDLLTVNYGYNPTVKSSEVYPVTPSIAWLQRHTGFDRIMPVNSRWSIIDPPQAVLPPNGATVYGLYDVQGYDSLQTRSYKEFTNELDGGVDSSPMENGNMDFANGVGTADAAVADARYLYTLAPITDFGKSLFSDGSTNVYEDVGASTTTNGARILTVGATSVTVRDRGPFDISMQWYPGWRADTFGADSHEIACSPGPRAMPQSAQPPTIRVDAVGSGTVVLRFQPTSFLIGLYFSLLGLLLTTAYGVMSACSSFVFRPLKRRLEGVTTGQST